MNKEGVPTWDSLFFAKFTKYIMKGDDQYDYIHYNSQYHVGNINGSVDLRLCWWSCISVSIRRCDSLYIDNNTDC